MKTVGEKETDNFIYTLGFRDAIAYVLAENKDKIKLKDLAEFYKSKWEEHFSHKWHTE